MATKLGRDLQVGDVIVFLGAGHRIIRFEPYAWFVSYPARCAICELGWTFTVFDDAEVEVAA